MLNAAIRVVLGHDVHGLQGRLLFGARRFHMHDLSRGKVLG